MPWRYVHFRGSRVLARCLPGGELAVEGGRVEIRYRATDRRAYRAGERNLKPVEDEALLADDHCAEAEPVDPAESRPRAGSKAGGKSAAKAPPTAEHPKDAVVAYTDGACSGNPGPAGLGVVLLDNGVRRELSEYLGTGTNNIAELSAIGRAADGVEPDGRPLRIHTDSKYAIGVLQLGWKAKKNQELIAGIKKSLAQHQDWGLVYVPGHAGVPLNERADELAVQAVRERGSDGWIDI